MAMLIADLFHSSTVRAELVGYDNFWGPIALHRFSQEFQGRSLVPGLRDVSFEDLAFMVDRAPEVVRLASNLHEHFVQVPAPLRHLAHSLGSPFPDRSRKMGPEPLDPEPHTFMTNINATLMEQVLDVPQRQRKSNIHHDRKLDDLGRCLEVAKGILSHFPRLSPGFGLFNPDCSDNAG